MKVKLKEIESLSELSLEKIHQVNSYNLDESKIIAVKFWRKFIQNNKAIVKLVEQGFFDEAFVVYRLSFEHLFNMFALIKDKDFIKQLKNNSDIGISKVLNEINKSHQKSTEDILTPENKKLLDAALKEYEKSPLEQLGYSLYNAAQISEMKHFYDSIYRLVSLSYAHSTYISIAVDDSKNEIDELLDNLISFLRIAKDLVTENFKE